jgi:hypothetical protein
MVPKAVEELVEPFWRTYVEVVVNRTQQSSLAI